MKGFKKPLLLLAIFLVLTAIAYWDEKQTVEDEKIAETKNRFLDFNPNEIQSLRFVRQGQPEILLERTEGKPWRVKEPLDYPADSEGVDRLLKTVSELQFEKDFGASKESLKDYGLEKPQIRLVLKDGKKSWDLQIGSKSPVGYSSYVRVGDQDKVFLVSHYVFTATNKELYDFRDKSLHVPALQDLAGLHYHWQGEEIIQLAKSGEQWTIEKPAQFAADPGEIRAFLDLLNRQKVTSFIDSPVPELRQALTTVGKGSSRIVSVFFDHADGKKSSFEMIENNGRLYAKLPIGDSFAELDVKAKDEFHKKMSDFQNRSLFSFNATDVKSIEIDGKLYEKDQDNWVSAKDKQRSDFVRSLLVDLEFAKADAALTADEGAKATQGPPQHTVVISSSDGKNTTFSLWKNLDRPGELTVKIGDSQFFRAQDEIFDGLKSKDSLSPNPELGLGGQPKGKS